MALVAAVGSCGGWLVAQAEEHGTPTASASKIVCADVLWIDKKAAPCKKGPVQLGQIKAWKKGRGKRENPARIQHEKQRREARWSRLE